MIVAAKRVGGRKHLAGLYDTTVDTTHRGWTRGDAGGLSQSIGSPYARFEYS
jgi:hypothetical protein